MQVSFAARGVLNKLNEKFNNMNFLFAEFYDFDRGIDPYFKRRLCQVPMEERGQDWLAIMWSRDPHTLSLNNRLYSVVTNNSDIYAELSDVRFVYCSIVFSYISNSMSYLEKLERHFFKYVPDGFSVLFDNTPNPEWDAKQSIQKGYIRQSRRYNGHLYKCIQAGVTGDFEPEWSAIKDVSDGSVIWTPIEPDRLKVQFDNVAYSGMEKFSLDSEDSLCKLDIGGRMLFPLFLNDSGEPDNILPRILYPKDEIAIKNVYPEYEEYVSPTREYWRSKLGK